MFMFNAPPEYYELWKSSIDDAEGFCVVEMTPLGYPDEQPSITPRKELSEIVFYDRYG